jgi:hypothetical protein
MLRVLRCNDVSQQCAAAAASATIWLGRFYMTRMRISRHSPWGGKSRLRHFHLAVEAP